jgi:hypothetical protein
VNAYIAVAIEVLGWPVVASFTPSIQHPKKVIKVHVAVPVHILVMPPIAASTNLFTGNTVAHVDTTASVADPPGGPTTNAQ